MATKFEEIAIVLSQKQIAEGIFDLTIKTQDIAAHAKAGQFISLYCNDGTQDTKEIFSTTFFLTTSF